MVAKLGIRLVLCSYSNPYQAHSVITPIKVELPNLEEGGSCYVCVCGVRRVEGVTCHTWAMTHRLSESRTAADSSASDVVSHS